MQFSELSKSGELSLRFVCVHNDPLKLLNMMEMEGLLSRLGFFTLKCSFQGANVLGAKSLTSDNNRRNNRKQLLEFPSTLTTMLVWMGELKTIRR